MAVSIYFDQPEYKLFRKAFAERKAPLVFVIGSGFSVSAGLPSWSKLREFLESESTSKANALNQIGHAVLGPKIESLKKQRDPWVAFKLIKEVLTPPVFEQLIEQKLSISDECETPASYAKLLELAPQGVITLNLDKFAEQSLADSRRGEPVTPIYGNELAKKWTLLKSSKIFLVYLHGGIHDPSTWILTQNDLSSIVGMEGHRHFLNSVFLDNIVLFVGVSADDIALSQRLVSISNAGFRPRNLYWLTNRRDRSAEDWAAEAYIKIIRYTAENDVDHNTVIKSLVDDCKSYISRDEIERPLLNESSPRFNQESIITDDPDALAQYKPEEIRKTIAAILDRELRPLSGNDTNAVIKTYRDLCDRFDYAVHRAFYRSSRAGYKKWFDYELDLPSLGRGNFGEVYSGRDLHGNLVAVKIMHDSIFGNDDMLGGFRRGVRSMQIVTKNAVKGMVPIIESFELPPTIIMPFIGGVSLEECLTRRPDLPWLTKLYISKKIGSIVTTGHALPQTILHRDLKPSNIMIENFEYSGNFLPEIVVLDFDMSWHKGSKERDIVFESRDDFGYLAPEQTDPSNRYAARSTRVDSYGFGMTLFYIFGHEPPRPNEALSDLWVERARRATERGYSGNWKSAPYRLARLIQRATQIEQNLRVDFSTMVHDLEFIYSAVNDPDEMDNPELWAEEALFCMSNGIRYIWEDALGHGFVETPSGIRIDTWSNFRDMKIIIEIRYIDGGLRERGSLGRYLGAATVAAEQILQKKGWRALDRRVGSGEGLIKLECYIDVLRQHNRAAMLATLDAVRQFQF